jgi:hypothetical protein
MNVWEEDRPVQTARTTVSSQHFTAASTRGLGWGPLEEIYRGQTSVSGSGFGRAGVHVLTTLDLIVGSPVIGSPAIGSPVIGEGKQSGVRYAGSRSSSDDVIMELERLEPGWAGAESMAPSQEFIAQIEAVLDQLPPNAAVPLIEVEEEDGSVSLRWIAMDRNRSFSLVFRGNGRVICVGATVEPPKSKTWSAAIDDEAAIGLALEEQIALIIG